MKDGTRYATGYWAEEFAKPYKILTDAGHEVVVATPNGVTPNVDMMSLRPEISGGIDGALELEAIIRSPEAMRQPLQLSDVAVDVGEPTMRRSLKEISGYFPSAVVAGVVADFDTHLGHLPAGDSRIVVFLGGTIGNLEPERRRSFLSNVADRLAPGE